VMAEQPPPHKSFWERILTTTPVIMTILSTILAGLSSSEMTQAQYHRSLAAQNQSRAGDQWGFYQAKRIRGSGLENTAELLQTQIVLGDPSELEDLANRVTSALKASEKNAQQALAKFTSEKSTSNEIGSHLKKIAEVAKAQTGQAPKSDEEIRRLIS